MNAGSRSASAADAGRCRACGGDDLREIYHLDAIPVQSCVLLDPADEAAAYPHAPLTLQFCNACGMIFNSAFDASLVDYASATEESQHFSGTFNAFARELVAEIAARIELRDRLKLEIGCGKGEFLRELCQVSGTRALGVDPGFIPERLDTAANQWRLLRGMLNQTTYKGTAVVF